MINITEIVESAGWKKFMGKLYAWGAAIVLLGALFKIQHWAGASEMLTVGMLTEVVIFLFSGFEPLHEELDWTLVYPELAGISGDENFVPDVKGQGTLSSGGGFSKFDEMLENAEITPAVFEKLGVGLKNLNTTTQNLVNISDVTSATNQYVDNLQAASESISSMAENYGKSSESLTNSVDSLTNSYNESSNKIVDSGNMLADQVVQTSEKMGTSYQSFEEGVQSQVGIMSDGGKSYGEKLSSLNNNLEALNTAYELQLQTTNDQMKNSQGLYSNLNEMMGNLEGTVQETKQYRNEITKLNESLSALNSVYGNMLSAMNITNK